MKITIEYLDQIVVIEKEVVTTEEVVRMCYQAMVGSGHNPINVSEWMVEIGNEERNAL